MACNCPAIAGAGQGLGHALPSWGALEKPGLLRGAWTEAEWHGVDWIKQADRFRAWLWTFLLPFCFAAPYRASGVGWQLGGACCL